MPSLIKVYYEMVIDIVITYKIVLESFAGILRGRIPMSESVKLELRR